MKANYSNWMPKRLIVILRLSAVAFVVAFFGVAFLALGGNDIKTGMLTIAIVLAIMSLVLGIIASKFNFMRRSFDYDNEESISWKIIRFTAEKLEVEGSEAKVIDVGCGSGALSIEVAKRNPTAEVVGVDLWGFNYHNEFSKEICEENARIEGVTNINFEKGDARTLPFEDESFDALCSNYVYHNIPGDRNKLLRESLRLIKKGGTFAIHDLFTKKKYPKLDELMKELKAEGYEKIELIDTTDGKVLRPDEAKKTMLTGSKLLYGRK